MRRFSDLDYDSFVGLMGRRSTDGESGSVSILKYIYLNSLNYMPMCILRCSLV